MKYSSPKIPHVDAQTDVAPELEKFNAVKLRLLKADSDLQQASTAADAKSLRECDAALANGQPFVHQPPKELAALYAERNALRRAVEYQKGKLTEAREAAGKRIAQAARPDYEAIVKSTATKMKELRELVVAEVEFRQALSAAGVPFASYIPPCGIRPGMTVEDCAGWIDFWLAEAKRQWGA